MNDSVHAVQQTKALLRKQMRLRRRGLTPAQQKAAALGLYRRLVTSSLFRFSKRIAFTIARDGEIDPMPLMREAHRRGKACYLPVMDPVGRNRLRFRRWRPEARLVGGAYGIPEPGLGRACSPRVLDLVLLPLVAFDAAGRRLGMGRGFYDSSFAFKRRSPGSRPRLLGLAHECQRLEALEVASWDVPLEGIVTDQRWYKA